MKCLGLIKKALVGSIATLCIASIAYGEELKVCESKQDKMSGCIEMIEGEESYTNTPYKNGKIHGVVEDSMLYCEGAWMGESKVPYVNGKKEGEAQLFVNTKLVATIKYANDKFVSGKCTNGKALSKSGPSDAISSPDACSGGYVCPVE